MEWETKRWNEVDVQLQLIWYEWRVFQSVALEQLWEYLFSRDNSSDDEKGFASVHNARAYSI